MSISCDTCKFRYTYKECLTCRSCSKYKKGDAVAFFLALPEKDDICRYPMLGEVGCQKCIYMIKCKLLREEKHD